MNKKSLNTENSLIDLEVLSHLQKINSSDLITNTPYGGKAEVWYSLLMDQLAHKAEDCVIIAVTIKTKSYFACVCNITQMILVFSICIAPPSKLTSQNTLKTLN